MAGNVIVVVRAFPKEVMNDFTALLDKIRMKIKGSAYELAKWESVDIAFGYKALDLYFIMPEDIEGGTENLEELIKSVDDIDNVEVVYITRIGA
ncbi:elongation factor 1-beta [Ignisphaera sp. 4213-co]|uniref:Elongation factor 1-beta n=1 Tax=Ignisphaera cupida TaxID=3050454 RepID=A0ABD4Z593_9CREN|nr:elongation factor 1-beta [Ignisphaera sp. 4213-co]MDK6027798.1 elongation factor 1-beta [Ignisphaera sp. 4213-co]